MRTFKLQTFKIANVRSHVQSRKVVHMSGVHCVHPLQVLVLLCTLQYGIEYSSTGSLVQAQDVWKEV